eukprot:11199495-Lingulodinium_polyedra.AAC.1
MTPAGAFHFRSVLALPFSCGEAPGSCLCARACGRRCPLTIFRLSAGACDKCGLDACANGMPS